MVHLLNQRGFVVLLGYCLVHIQVMIFLLSSWLLFVHTLAVVIPGPNTFQPIVFQRHQVESAINGVALEGRLIKQALMLSRLDKGSAVDDDLWEPLDPWNDIEYGPPDMNDPRLVPVLQCADIDPGYEGRAFPSAMADRYFTGGGGSQLCHSLHCENYKSLLSLIHHLQENCGKMDPIPVSTFHILVTSILSLSGLMSSWFLLFCG